MPWFSGSSISANSMTLANVSRTHSRQLRSGVFQNPRQRYVQMAPSLADSDATFEQQSTNLIETAVRRTTQRSRTRCRDCRSNWSSVLMGTKRIVGRVDVGLHILCRYHGARPCSRSARLRKWAPPQASMPINSTRCFAVKRRSCVRENFLLTPTSPRTLSPTR
jgi:hypothetical protein